MIETVDGELKMFSPPGDTTWTLTSKSSNSSMLNCIKSSSSTSFFGSCDIEFSRVINDSSRKNIMWFFIE
jgi:hypothetical protein